MLRFMCPLLMPRRQEKGIFSLLIKFKKLISRRSLLMSIGINILTKNNDLITLRLYSLTYINKFMLYCFLLYPTHFYIVKKLMFYSDILILYY